MIDAGGGSSAVKAKLHSLDGGTSNAQAAPTSLHPNAVRQWSHCGVGHGSSARLGLMSLPPLRHSLPGTLKHPSHTSIDTHSNVELALFRPTIHFTTPKPEPITLARACAQIAHLLHTTTQSHSRVRRSGLPFTYRLLLHNSQSTTPCLTLQEAGLRPPSPTPHPNHKARARVNAHHLLPKASATIGIIITTTGSRTHIRTAQSLIPWQLHTHKAGKQADNKATLKVDILITATTRTGK